MIILYYPETTGKTLEEMDHLFDGKLSRTSEDTDLERDAESQPVKVQHVPNKVSRETGRAEVGEREC